MTQIINNTSLLLSPECEAAINNACCHKGIDKVFVHDDMHPDYPFVSVQDENGNRLYYANIFSDEIHPYD